MGTIAKAGVDQVINVAEHAVDGAIAAIDATQNAAFETGAQAVGIGDKTADATMAEVRELKERLVTLLRAYADAVTAVLP